jgi:hypothetical protein
MIDLVIWSTVIAFTPVALDLAWRLISGAGELLGLGRSAAPPRTFTGLRGVTRFL